MSVVRRFLCCSSLLCCTMLFSGCYVVNSCNQKASEPTWQQIHPIPDEYLHDLELIRAADGGYFIAAGISNGERYESQSLYLIRTNADGDVLWANLVTTSHRNLQPRAVVETPDGGFFVAAQSLPEYSDFDTSDSELFVARVDPAGELLWSREFPGDDNEIPLAVANREGGGFKVGTESVTAGNLTLFNAHALDENGDLVETLVYPLAEDFWLAELVPLADDAWITIGVQVLDTLREKETSEKLTPAPDITLEVAELDRDGNVIWKTPLGRGYPSSAALSTSGSIGILTYGAFFRLNADGALLFARSLPRGFSGSEIKPDSDDGFFLGGTMGEPRITGWVISSCDNMAVMQFDDTSQLRWSKEFHPSALPYQYMAGFAPTTDGGCVLASGFETELTLLRADEPLPSVQATP